MKLGLMMETAERHQKLAETAIAKLNEQTDGLQSVVRDQIRRALVEEMKTAQAETQSAVDALRRVKRAANARVTLWTLGLTAISAGVPSSSPGGFCLRGLKSQRCAPSAMSSRVTLQSSNNAERERICGAVEQGTSAFG